MAKNESTKQPENGNNQNSRVYLTVQEEETKEEFKRRVREAFQKKGLLPPGS